MRDYHPKALLTQRELRIRDEVEAANRDMNPVRLRRVIELTLLLARPKRKKPPTPRKKVTERDRMVRRHRSS